MAEYDWNTLSGYRSWVPRPPPEVVEPLPELNTYCLDVLVEQARAGTAHPAACRVAERWLGLDAVARKRLVSQQYLLFSAGFSDLRRWGNVDYTQVGDASEAEYKLQFVTPRAITGAQFVLCYAWSIAGRYANHAPLALGMHPQCARHIAKLTILRMLQLAHRTAGWLRPRWLDAPEVWDDLVHGAVEGGAAHTHAGLQGMRLMVSELAAVVHGGGHKDSG